MNITLDQVVASPFQLRPVRVHTREFTQLRNSIDRQGVLQPILVRPVGDKFEIVDGLHRFEIAKQLRHETIPVLVRDMTDQEVLAAQISANTQRIQTLDADLARRIWKISKKVGIETLAYELGRSTGWIRQVCGMEKLKPELMSLFEVGELTFRKAYLLSNIPREHQLDCWTLPEPEIQFVVRQLKATGRIPRRQDVTPMYRPLRQTVEEMEKPVEAGRIILNETDGSPVEVWKAALRWVSQMDGETKKRRISKKDSQM